MAIVASSADQDPRGRQDLLKYVQNLQNNLFRQQDLKTFNTIQTNDTGAFTRKRETMYKQQKHLKNYDINKAI